MEKLRTLVIILHYNLVEYTQPLFDMLYSFERDDYVLYVIDNGSISTKSFSNSSKSIKLPENIYFGGALNYAFQMMLSNEDKFDSLLFLNNDLILSGNNFVNALRHYLFDSDKKYHIVSPSVIQLGTIANQCKWRQMWNWNASSIRDVKWIDFQCPIFHIDFIKEVKQYHELLNKGWGNDVYSGIICKDKNWNIGVLDNVPVIHLTSKTIETHQHLPEIKDYNKNAYHNMFKYFTEIHRLEELHEMRKYGETYQYQLVN